MPCMVLSVMCGCMCVMHMQPILSAYEIKTKVEAKD